MKVAKRLTRASSNLKRALGGVIQEKALKRQKLNNGEVKKDNQTNASSPVDEDASTITENDTKIAGSAVDAASHSSTISFISSLLCL